MVQLHLLEGYSPDAKMRLTTALTDAVRFVVPAPDEAITVMVQEYAPDAYARGGRHRCPAPARPDPVGRVRDFLSAMEHRDLAAARAMLAPDFRMLFPGTGPMHDLDALIAWAKDRYAFVRKSHDGIDAFQSERATIVYVRGTLSGAWPDGTAFDGIRFIDRFEVADDRINRQEVWNDISEMRPQ